MLKGVDEINNILNNYLKKFDAEAIMDTDFWCNINTNVIAYSLIVFKDMDKWFHEFCCSLGLKNNNIDIFILSLYHEIFHLETIDDISEEEYNYCQDIKATLKNHNKKDAFIYFNLPDEFIATSAAIDYINNNAEEVTALWQELLPAINNFYKINNVEV